MTVSAPSGDNCQYYTQASARKIEVAQREVEILHEKLLQDFRH